MKQNFLKLAVAFVLMAVLVCTFAVAVHAEEGTVPPPCTESADGKHLPGRNVTCTTDAVCDLCGVVLVKALGHNPGPVATCANPQTCTTCGDVLNPQLEQNEENCLANIEAATCTENRVCKICSRIMNKALGHTEEGTVDCGHAVKCSTCKTITQNATGNHTLDWANATVLKEATEDSPAKIAVKCTTCNRTYERTRLESSSEEGDDTNGNGYGSIATTDAPAGTRFEVNVLKVADYADTDFGKKHTMLQTFNAVLRGAEGAVQPTGKVAVTVRLNKTVSTLSKGDVELYAIKEDGSYEKVNILSMENGEIKFETEYLSQFAIVEKQGLPLGALIGIIAGAVVIVGGAVTVTLVLVLKKKKPSAAVTEEAPTENDAQ